MKPDTYREHLNDLQLEVEELRAKLAAYQSTMGQLSDTAQSTKEGDTISRQAAIDEITEYGSCDIVFMSVGELKRRLEQLPTAQSELEEKIRAIGYTGKEGRIYIGGRLFAVRELAQ